MGREMCAYSRGSEWRQWDLHIHTPASFHWEGKKFKHCNTSQEKNALVDDMISAINDAEPAVFALMDYWTFEGWFELCRRLQEPGSPTLNKTVLPGIELRLAAPTKVRLNAHVLFSDEINEQYLRDFSAHLKLELVELPLSEHALRQYASSANADKLKKIGFEKDLVLKDPDMALLAGSMMAEVNCDSYKAAIRKVPDGLAVGFMPFSTNDGLSSIDWNDHYAYALGLFRSSPIFEARDHDTWAAFAGVQTEGNANWIGNFQSALSNTPRLAVSGSDSHRFRGAGKGNDKRGYGDFPSGKTTWIKADPTWLGLLQTIKEPAKRSYIGSLPPKLDKIRLNKTFYIDTISIKKHDEGSPAPNWLHGCNVRLNPDLVAIIGNKGSGKSALADIIALLGNSQQRQHFSFLKRDRFRGKSGEPARQFRGVMSWLAGEPNEATLSDDPALDKVELVKYIPQGRFEALCNDHVAGRSDSFEKELRSVIFSHVDESTRLDALDFDQLIEQQEATFRASLSESRKELRSLNAEIVAIEDQLQPNVKKNLEEQLRLKLQQLDEHQRLRPGEILEPAEDLTEPQLAARARLTEIAGQISLIEKSVEALGVSRQTLALRNRSTKNIRDRLGILEKQFKEFQVATASDFATINANIDEVIQLTVHIDQLDAYEQAQSLADVSVEEQLAVRAAERAALDAENLTLAATLNEPQQKYQQYLIELKVWQATMEAIQGKGSVPESMRGIEARLKQIKDLPDTLTAKKLERCAITGELHRTLAGQRAARAAWFAPLQKVIQENSLIRDEYKLQFQAKLEGSHELISSRLFEMVKQNVGELRGEDESYAAIRARFEKYSFELESDAVAFARDVSKMLEDAAADSAGIRSLLRKDKEPIDVYDHIFGLEYLEPRYTLLFQDTPIEQLSPGQRGALLLIFYLLVDKGRNPIILDQPEENLDNETVVSLLVPVLNEAKKSRQIIMVTHNPNLAVVCDAEQIIYAEFNRKDGPTISYHSGSIENKQTNKRVVDVLEGTKPAFDNRSRKYHQ